MKKTILLLLVLAVGGFAYYRYYTTTPQYSLLQARAAVLAHDPAGFGKYVDVESVASGLVQAVGQQGGLLSGLNPGS